MPKTLIDSLLRAAIDLEADAVVVDTGRIPYAVSGERQIDLAGESATAGEIQSILADLLTPEMQDALDRMGALEQPLPARDAFPDEQLTITVVRVETSTWLEVRRFAAPGQAVRPIAVPSRLREQQKGSMTANDLVVRFAGVLRQIVSITGILLIRLLAAIVALVKALGAAARSAAGAVVTRLRSAMFGRHQHRPALEPEDDFYEQDSQVWIEEARPDTANEDPLDFSVESFPLVSPAGAFWSLRRGGSADDLLLPDVGELWPDDNRVRSVITPGGDDLDFDGIFEDHAGVHSMPLPPERPTVIAEGSFALPWPPTLALDGESALARLLRMAAAQRASILHIASDSRPAIRVDADMQFFEHDTPVSSGALESMLLACMPESAVEALRNGLRAEWVIEVPEVGRVFSTALFDQRGLSSLFRLSAAHAMSADDLGLSPEVQALALEPEGLILLGGPRSSGKGALVTAFVDLVNRLRREYVIVFQTEIAAVHEPRGSVISQRQLRGGLKERLAAIRAALDEDPDVVIIEDMRFVPVIRLAMEAAAAGHLIIAGLPARTAPAAIETIVDAYTPEHRSRAYAVLAEKLCGVVTQVMVRKLGGGSVIAREVLLNTADIAKQIAAGRGSHLPSAIESGRTRGMLSLDHTLVDYVREGAVDIHEAYRRIGDRTAFLGLLRQQGIDTSVLEPTER